MEDPSRPHEEASGGALLGDAIAPGTMAGEYRIGELIGRGSFGDVYAGEQPLIGKDVAIKVLSRRFSAEPEMVSRFIVEARAVNRIRHRNIVDIFSFGTLPNRRHYFVMERLVGVTLASLLEREGRLSPSAALPILRGVAHALQAAHDAGIAHRDLKADNVFVTEHDGAPFPVLLDFGVAKLLDDSVATHKTATGAAIGTPAYMSPEQARGAPADPRSDIYSFGVLVHELLTGSRPFTSDSTVELLMQHAAVPPPPMSSVRPELGPDLDRAVLAMLEKDPEKRPQRIAEAFSKLEAAAARE